MSSTTADYSTNTVYGGPETAGISVEVFQKTQPEPPRQPFLRGVVSNCLLAIAATFTAPGIHIDPFFEQRRSVTSPIVWSVPRRRKRRISLREARDLALQIFEKTERNLQQERRAEANFLLKPWENDGGNDV
jgi:hypothetical protein